jgi:mono/diheme cytochrome c family protein
MLRISLFAAVTGVLLLISATGQAQESGIERGHGFAQENCARCHAIDPVGDSPLPKAPPFRTLHQRYPLEDLAESLAEGIKIGHPAMPNFELGQDQINNLIAYLKSLNE